MSGKERRFRQRYDAAALKLEVRTLNVFGHPGKAHRAIVRNFSLGGVSILSPLKMREGKKLLLSITSDDHRLLAIPASVIRVEAKEGDYLYAIKFSMGQIPEAASRGAYAVLQHLEINLKQAMSAS